MLPTHPQNDNDENWRHLVHKDTWICSGSLQLILCNKFSVPSPGYLLQSINIFVDNWSQQMLAHSQNHMFGSSLLHLLLLWSNPHYHRRVQFDPIHRFAFNTLPPCWECTKCPSVVLEQWIILFCHCMLPTNPVLWS